MSLDDEDTPPNAATTKVYEAPSEAPNDYEVLGKEDSIKVEASNCRYDYLKHHTRC